MGDSSINFYKRKQLDTTNLFSVLNKNRALLKQMETAGLDLLKQYNMQLYNRDYREGLNRLEQEFRHSPNLDYETERKNIAESMKAKHLSKANEPEFVLHLGSQHQLIYRKGSYCELHR